MQSAECSSGTPSGRRWGRCSTPSSTSRSRDLEFVRRAPCPSRRRSPTVRLRLPTFFCAPNFSWLMVADAYDAVSAVPGVTRADIALEDHFVAEEINEGVAARSGFVAAFSGRGPGRARRAAQRRSTARRRWPGRTGGPAAGRRRCHARRNWRSCGSGRYRRHRSSTGCASGGRMVGLPHDDDAPLLLHPDGEPVTAAQVPLHLRRARLTRREHRGATAARAATCSRSGTPPRPDESPTAPPAPLPGGAVACPGPAPDAVGCSRVALLSSGCAAAVTLLRSVQARLGMRPPHRTCARRFGGIRPL